MICKNCGLEFDEGIFCPECGTRIDNHGENDQLKDQKEKNELEIEKAKAEQERYAKEKAEHEAELLRQRNENIRLEQEIAEKKKEEEKKREEEEARTFNGVLYNSVEEMVKAKEDYSIEESKKKEKKRTDFYALMCLIFGIAAFPLIITLFGWFPAVIASTVFGVLALKRKTEKRVMVIIGLICDAVFYLMMIAGMVIPIVINNMQ